MAALLSGRFDAAWARWSRPWTTAAWVFLTAGIALGRVGLLRAGLGRLVVLGPGGERVLHALAAGTALIHSLAVTEKRGAFKLDRAAGDRARSPLSLLGTFLVRSGVLTSVHAVSPPTPSAAASSSRSWGDGDRRLAALFAGVRRGGLRGGSFSRVSRESRCWATTCCWWWPLALRCCWARCIRSSLDALGLGKISVGPPYFEAVFVPLMAPVVC
jgi:cytochrome c-type biogenesis protein CcmF